MPGQVASPDVPLDRQLRQSMFRRWVLYAMLISVIASLAWADRHGLLLFQGSDLHHYHCRWFTVVHVVDGDTLDVDTPDGDKPHTRVRLWGINAPETAKAFLNKPGQPWGQEAGERLTALCDGRRVRLWLEPSRLRDRFGRVLAHVEVPDGSYANETLLLEGLARDDNRWPHARQYRYSLLAEQARRDHVGIWSSRTVVNE